MRIADDLLQQGIALSKSGRKQDANRIFETLIHNDRFNETAWVWYIFTLKSEQEQIAALEKFLAVFPEQTTARKALLTLRREAMRSISPPQPIGNSREPAWMIPRTGPVPIREKQPVRISQTSSGSLLAVILGACLLFVGLVLFVKGDNAERTR